MGKKVKFHKLKIMPKIVLYQKIISFLLCIFMLILPLVSFADNNSTSTVTSITDVLNVLQTAANWFLAIVLVLAVIIFIYVGFTFMTAEGDAEKIEKAKKMLFWAIIGVIVAFLSYGLRELIRNLLERT